MSSNGYFRGTMCKIQVVNLSVVLNGNSNEYRKKFILSRKNNVVNGHD
jgi:hypothetical protein